MDALLNEMAANAGYNVLANQDGDGGKDELDNDEEEEELEEVDPEEAVEATTESIVAWDQTSKRIPLWRPDIKPPREALTHVKSRKASTRPLPTSTMPDIGIELLRYKAIGQLTCLFLNKLFYLPTYDKVNRSMDLDLRIPSFERWTFMQRDGNGDPILPDPHVDEQCARAGRKLLLKEVEEGGAGKKEAKKVINQLDKAAVKMLRQVQREASGLVASRGGGGGGGGVNAGVRIRLMYDPHKKLYVLQHKSTTLSVNKFHYDKLRILFNRHGRGGERQKNGDKKKKEHASHIRPPTSASAPQDQDDRRFHLHVFALLLRMSALAGGTDRGGGFQGAINEECFEVLLKYFDCRMECFASPLNCRYGRYCSAFEDVDAAFGSIGNFFDFHPTSGCYEANPPFVPYLMMKMAIHMENLLQKATDALCFIVVIPTWEKDKSKRVMHVACGPSWNKLLASEYCVRHLVLNAMDHGYIEGNQQRLPTRWKTSQFDTSVVFVQNEAAKKKWPVTDEACEELRKAFASKHDDETKSRRAAAAAGGGGDEGASTGAVKEGEEGQVQEKEEEQGEEEEVISSSSVSIGNSPKVRDEEGLGERSQIKKENEKKGKIKLKKKRLREDDNDDKQNKKTGRINIGIKGAHQKKGHDQLHVQSESHKKRKIKN